MAMKPEEITQLIKKSIPDAIIDIKDLVGDNNHYAATITSWKVIGKSKIQQHQIVYAALQGYMGDALHALSLTTVIPLSNK